MTLKGVLTDREGPENIWEASEPKGTSAGQGLQHYMVIQELGNH